MPLPDNGAAWPPPRYSRALSSMAEWSAWYGGDPATLTDYYLTNSRALARTRPSQTRGGVVGAVARWWWGTPTPAGEKPVKLHVPLAADICGTSADLLFSEPVQLSGDNDTLQEALDELQEGGLDSQLHEAAEVTSALGGGYLRVCWDKDMSRLPWTDAVHADMALPEFRWGRLFAVTFWQKLHGPDDRTVWRLLERHESGRIIHALFRGTGDNLGQRVPLQDHPDAADLATIVDEEGATPTGTDRLTATYVPNMLPNRLDRGSHQGRSDLQGVEPWLDALDEAYSSWWRDIRHAKSRIHVPRAFIDASAGPGQAGSVNLDQELYVPMDGILAGATHSLESMMQVQQFTIRVQEHKDTCEFWTNKIIESAGYSTQSLSSGSGGAVTAAEVHSHERRSYMTRGKKVRYWRHAITDHLRTLAEVANANLSAGIQEGAIKVEFQDGVQESAMNIAQTMQTLRNAEAASIETRVKMLHPEWEDSDVQAEVAAIRSETGAAPLADPDTIHLHEPEADPADLKAKADAMGALIRSGADPLAAAREVGLDRLTFTGAVPTTLRLPASDANVLEDA